MKLRELAVSIFCLVCLVEQGLTGISEIYSEFSFGDEYPFNKLRIKKRPVLDCFSRNKLFPEVTIHQIGETIIKNERSGNTGIKENEKDFLNQIFANVYGLNKRQGKIYADEDDLMFPVYDDWEPRLYQNKKTQTRLKNVNEDEIIRYLLSNNNEETDPSFITITETQPPSTTEPPNTTESPSTTEAPSTTDSSTTTESPSTTDSPTTTESPSTTESKSTTDSPTTTESPSTTEAPSTTDSPTTTESPTTTINPITTSVAP